MKTKHHTIFTGALFLFLLLSASGFSQSGGQNYIAKKTYKNASGSSHMLEVTYYDGLGRPVETVQKSYTSGGKDLVTRIEYDGMGRQWKTYLPAPGAYSDGRYYGSSTAATFYVDTAAYSETIYEASPLNRVREEYGPGTAWRANSRSVKTEHLTNTTTANGVQTCTRYTLVDRYSFKRDGVYPANSLFVTKITDENNNVSYEFKDKLGRVLLQRRMDGSEKSDTYFIYDDFGDIIFVLPPVPSDKLTTNRVYKIFDGSGDTYNASLNNYGYYYKYDSRRRIEFKHSPECDEAFVYDKADRLVMHQTRDAPSTDCSRGWIFNKYDAMGRIILSGIYHGDDGSTADINARVGNMKSRFESVVSKETASTTEAYGYTWNTFPKNTTAEPVTVTQVNYYDDYSFLNLGTGILNGVNLKDSLKFVSGNVSGGQHSSAKGLLTGTRYRLLDGSNRESVTAYYYDANGNIVQEHSTNHLGGYDHVYFTYNYNNLVTQKIIQHRISGQTSPIKETYSYSYATNLNLISSSYSLSGNSACSYSISYTYDGVGRLKTKKMGSANPTTYTYNLRGWTEQISHYSFTEKLYYTTNPKSGGKTYFNGNIAAMTTSSPYDASSLIRGYSFEYDGMDRMKKAIYGEGSTLSTNAGRFSEEFGYDKNGNVNLLKRNGLKDNNTYGLIDDLHTFVYTGNRLTRVSERAMNQSRSNLMEFKSVSGTGAQYGYDYGKLTTDWNRNICKIKYNYLALPRSVQFGYGHRIEYTYDASGRKLQTKHMESKRNMNWQMYSENELTSTDVLRTTTRNYIGNKIYSGTELSRILTEEGFLVKNGSGTIDMAPNYVLTDHLGNIRVEYSTTGSSPTVNNYYPSGTTMATTLSAYSSSHPYKFSGKELDKTYNLNWYDFEARQYDPTIMRFTTIDPMREKYYGVSPYAYCNNNPVNRIDPTGMDWFTDIDGTYQFNPNLTADNYSEILKKGQAYVGTNHQVTDERGNIIENYREDGSIMFSNEPSGYRRIWNNTQKTGNEEMGVITNDGVLVLPSWGNTSNWSKVEEYGYSFKNGKLEDPISGNKESFSGTVHTHPNVMYPSQEDYEYFGNNTPNIPFYVFNPNMKISAVIPVNANTATPLILPPRGQHIGGIIYGGYSLKNIGK